MSGTKNSKRLQPSKLESAHAGSSRTPEAVVRGFLKWYRDHEAQLHQVPLVKGGLEDTTTYYSVDFTAAQVYLDGLRKSSFLSEKYLHDLHQYIKSSNDSLLKYPQNDGPAQGFDFDLVMQSQDYMDILENIDSLKVVAQQIAGGRATIVLDRPPYQKMVYTLSRTNHRWQIDALTYKNE